MTLKGSTAPRPVCDNAEHPRGKAPKMIRLYKRVNRKFIACGWVCPVCHIAKIVSNVT